MFHLRRRVSMAEVCKPELQGRLEIKEVTKAGDTEESDSVKLFNILCENIFLTDKKNSVQGQWNSN